MTQEHDLHHPIRQVVLSQTLSLMSLPLVASDILPVPLNKPFLGPIPLEKPPVDDVIALIRAEADPRALEFVCHRIGDKLASVTTDECLAFGFSSTGASARATPILSRDFRQDSPEPIKARVLVVGGTHGDEYSSVSVIFKWLAFLTQDAHAFHWRVTPLLNPDGLLRKKSTRTNANGVDLNRNLPTPNWLEESTYYWVNKTGSNPRRYPGAAALSEAENHWLVAQIEAFDPDVIISTHAPHGIVDFDGPPQGTYSNRRPGAAIPGHLPRLTRQLRRATTRVASGHHRAQISRHHAFRRRDRTHVARLAPVAKRPVPGIAGGCPKG